MKKLLILLLLAASLTGCQSLQIHSNSRPGWQADEVVTNTALWLSFIITLKTLGEMTLEEF